MLIWGRWRRVDLLGCRVLSLCFHCFRGQRRPPMAHQNPRCHKPVSLPEFLITRSDTCQLAANPPNSRSSLPCCEHDPPTDLTSDPSLSRSAVALGSTESLIPPIDWARGSPGWQPGLPTVDLTVLASAAPNGVFLQLDTTIGGQPIEVGGVAIIMKLRRLISHFETSRH